MFKGVKVLWYNIADGEERTPRIHLFEHNNNRDIILETICINNKIDLTYEKDNNTYYIIRNGFSVNDKPNKIIVKKKN